MASIDGPDLNHPIHHSNYRDNVYRRYLNIPIIYLPTARSAFTEICQDIASAVIAELTPIASLTEILVWRKLLSSLPGVANQALHWATPAGVNSVEEVDS